VRDYAPNPPASDLQRGKRSTRIRKHRVKLC
jgi:hypothetical protein